MPTPLCPTCVTLLPIGDVIRSAIGNLLSDSPVADLFSGGLANDLLPSVRKATLHIDDTIDANDGPLRMVLNAVFGFDFPATLIDESADLTSEVGSSMPPTPTVKHFVTTETTPAHLQVPVSHLLEGGLDAIAGFPTGGNAEDLNVRIESVSPPGAGGFEPGGSGGHLGFEINLQFITFTPGNDFRSLLTGESVTVDITWRVPGQEEPEHATVVVHGMTGNEGPEPPAPLPPPPVSIPTPIPTPAEPTNIITFNDRKSLDNLPDDGRFEVANNYTEDGITFRSGVIPPDPELGGTGVGVYRLAYENPFALAQAMQPTFDPTGQHRSLFSFGGSDIIQMTYDPDGDGVLDPFGVQSIRVLDGTLNVGVRYTDGTIAVYNNLTSGFDWTLIDATDLTRVTLEAIGPSFTVDDIHIL